MNKKQNLEIVKNFLELLEGVENVTNSSTEKYLSLDFTIVQRNCLNETVRGDFYIIFHDSGNMSIALEECRQFSIKCNSIKEITTLIQHIELD